MLLSFLLLRVPFAELRGGAAEARREPLDEALAFAEARGLGDLVDAQIGLQQEAFGLHAARIARQRTVAADHAVAGDEEYGRIAVVGHPDCAACFWIADGGGNIFICTRFSVWYFAEFSPYFFLKCRTAQFIWKIKCFFSNVLFVMLSKLELSNFFIAITISLSYSILRNPK